MAKLGQKGGNLIFLQVTKGNLVQRLDEHYQGDCIKRKLTMGPNTGKMVNELHFPSVEGYITEVAIKTGEYGNQVMVTLDNEICVQFGSNDFNSIANTLLNFGVEGDLFEEVNISCYIDKDGYGKFSVWQGGDMCKWFVTKEDNKGCPQAIRKEVAGQVKWDFDLVNDWYFKKLSEWISTYFAKGSVDTPVGATSNVTKQQRVADQGSVNDLHKDEDAPLPGYAKPNSVGKETPTENKVATASKSKLDQDEISVEDIPFR